MLKKRRITARTVLMALVLFALAFLLSRAAVSPASADQRAAEAALNTPAASLDAPETGKTVAQEDDLAKQLAKFQANLDTVWLLVAAFLVFFMQAGFALLEAGFVSVKHVVNIMMKNLFDFAAASIMFGAVGFGIMFGASNGLFGTEWFFLSGIPETYPGLTVPTYAFFFFQLVFAGTAATIASGAMGGRTEFRGYLLYSLIASAVIYPVVGHWIWGGGWLAKLETPFTDFAGSTVVHSTGAWIGLMGAIFLGPRLGRFGKDAKPMLGHNMTAATLGTFILWFGWFGFNPGSQLSADGAAIGLITVTTNLAAAGGAAAALFANWVVVGKPQLPPMLNGTLAGLVAITAPCAFVTPTEALIIGAIGGLVMYFGTLLLERLRVDDAVGAVPVHGFAGVWGTLAVGLFHGKTGLLHGGGVAQLISQAIGIVAVAAFVLVSSAIMFAIIKATVGLRVPEEGEKMGLDAYEHGMVSYPEYVLGDPTVIAPTNGRAAKTAPATATGD
ncbi:MAG: ammonium transporter [Anaerolineae bacterium]|nr:ammonium transporter [Anaerolineae bacterium]